MVSCPGCPTRAPIGGVLRGRGLGHRRVPVLRGGEGSRSSRAQLSGWLSLGKRDPVENCPIQLKERLVHSVDRPIESGTAGTRTNEFLL